MNKKVILILIIILVATGFIFFVIRSEKKRKGFIIGKQTVFDKLYNAVFSAGSKGKTNKNTSLVDENKEYFKRLGFGDYVLSLLSTKDAEIARFYSENYMRKGIKILPNDAIYSDVVRIAEYSNLFPKPV